MGQTRHHKSDSVRLQKARYGRSLGKSWTCDEASIIAQRLQSAKRECDARRREGLMAASRARSRRSDSTDFRPRASDFGTTTKATKAQKRIVRSNKRSGDQEIFLKNRNNS